MSVQSQIDRIEQNVANTYSVLNDMGATMPSVQNTDNLPNTAESLKNIDLWTITLKDGTTVVKRVVSISDNSAS